MDIDQTRRQNLHQICQQLTDGNQQKLADLLDRAQSLVNRYLNEKPIGSRFARYVEERLGLDKGALDAPPGTAGGDMVLLHHYLVSKEMAQVAADLEKLDPEVREQIAVMVHTLVANKRRSDRSAGKRGELISIPRLEADA